MSNPTSTPTADSLEDEERIVRQSERIGWANYFDAGYGLQPVARFIGDKLGPLPRSIQGQDRATPSGIRRMKA